MTQWGLDTLFNPAKRHMDEEKRRLQSTREEVGDNSGGRRINLESGKVRIARTADESDDSDTSEDRGDAAAEDAAEAGGREADGGEQAGADESDEAPRRELSPAAIRAARRRGREPR